jgi:She9 / Mdm33 family
MQKSLQSLPRTVFTLRNRHSTSLRFYVQASNGPSKSQTESERSDERSGSSVLFADKLSHARVRMREYLREMSGNGAVAIRKRADEFTASTETLFSRLGSQLNKATGYEDIEVLKSNVVKQGESLVYENSLHILLLCYLIYILQRLG